MAVEDQELQSYLAEFAAKGFSLAVQLLGNSDDAAEIVQDGLMVLWRNRANLDRDRNPKGWFYRVIRNLCVDRLRRRGLVGTVSLDDAPPPAHASTDPSQQAEANEYRAALRRELNSLPESLREILYLRDFHDLAYAELAEVLAIPVGTVMSRLHRARMELRKRMQQSRAGEPGVTP